MRSDRRLALTAGLLASLVAAATEARPAAVVPLVVVNLDADEADTLGRALARGLQDAGAGPVLGGRPVRRRLPDSGVAPDCPAQAPCVADLRDRLEAEALVFVIVSRVGDRLQIDPTVVLEGAGEARPALRGTRAELGTPAWVAARVSDWLPARPEALVSETPDIPTAAPDPVDSEVRGPAEARAWVAPSGLTIGVGGVGIAALAAGVGLGVSAKSMERDLVDAGCETRRCADEDIDALSRRATAADVAFVTGGLALAAAVALYLTVDDGPTTLSVAAGPSGAVVAGQF